MLVVKEGENKETPLKFKIKREQRETALHKIPQIIVVFWDFHIPLYIGLSMFFTDSFIHSFKKMLRKFRICYDG